MQYSEGVASGAGAPSRDFQGLGSSLTPCIRPFSGFSASGNSKISSTFDKLIAFMKLYFAGHRYFCTSMADEDWFFDHLIVFLFQF